MTIQRTGQAEWTGDLETGSGHLSTESGVVDADYDFGSRFEQGAKTNPEELIGAAHAACFSMALSNILDEAGHEPESVQTDATVDLDPSGPEITGVTLETRGRVPGMDEATFQKYAGKAKRECPVSGALGAVTIDLQARLAD